MLKLERRKARGGFTLEEGLKQLGDAREIHAAADCNWKHPDCRFGRCLRRGGNMTADGLRDRAGEKRCSVSSSSPTFA